MAKRKKTRDILTALLSGEPVQSVRINDGNDSGEPAQKKDHLKSEISPAGEGAVGAERPQSPDDPPTSVPKVEKSDAAPGSRSAGQTGQPYQFVCLRIGDQAYALPLKRVGQVLRMAALVTIPEAPSGIAGLLNLHGDVVPVVDLRERLGLAPKDSLPDDRLVLVQAGGQTVAVIADSVETVLEVPNSHVEYSLPSGQESRIVQAVIRESTELILVLKTAQITRMAQGSKLSDQWNRET